MLIATWCYVCGISAAGRNTFHVTCVRFTSCLSSHVTQVGRGCVTCYAPNVLFIRRNMRKCARWGTRNVRHNSHKPACNATSTNRVWSNFYPGRITGGKAEYHLGRISTVSVGIQPFWLDFNSGAKSYFSCLGSYSSLLSLPAFPAVWLQMNAVHTVLVLILYFQGVE